MEDEKTTKTIPCWDEREKSDRLCSDCQSKHKLMKWNKWHPLCLNILNTDKHSCLDWGWLITILLWWPTTAIQGATAPHLPHTLIYLSNRWCMLHQVEASTAVIGSESTEVTWNCKWVSPKQSYSTRCFLFCYISTVKTVTEKKKSQKYLPFTSSW